MTDMGVDIRAPLFTETDSSRQSERRTREDGNQIISSAHGNMISRNFEREREAEGSLRILKGFAEKHRCADKIRLRMI